ncbi:hypothetical protein GO491_01470 [Flavobacteriaceae bacterium Ap0902]|nr:hypothetical protein [Flavobacteriaceae bacterium Ap0902]
MNSENILYFNQLKAQVVQVFMQNHVVNSTDCNDWSGQEIELFQEDFIQKVKSGFSEKWFYTYFKNEVTKLPRIDMLNLMSMYAGYQNFADFKEKNPISEEISTNPIEENSTQNISNHKTKEPTALNKKPIFIAIGVIIVLGILYFILGLNKPTLNTYSFCFVEKSNHQAPKTPLRVTLLLKNESPLELKTNPDGCFHYTTENKEIKFVVQSPFHEPDTIVRHIKNQNNETISLRSNDYALMLQYYTSSNVKDWKRKRERLENIIAEKATIYRVYPQSGIALYNKKEFINQLTIPTAHLKNIQILEIEYDQNQIVKLKFTVTE